MGLMSFIKEAGEKLFGGGEAKAAEAAVQAAPTPENVAAMSAAAGTAIANYIETQGLAIGGLDVASTRPAAPSPWPARCPTRRPRKRCCCAAATSHGVAAVNDMLVVKAPEPESQWHTVVSGDNLSKIAKKFYGDANKYPVIFEANKPMLKHPDKIYPGQLLRIPPA